MPFPLPAIFLDLLSGLLMVLFALLMTVIGGLMLFQERNDTGEENELAQPEHHNAAGAKGFQESL